MRGTQLWTGTGVRRRWRFPLTAGNGAVDGATSRQKRTTQQRAATCAARETLIRRMPVLSVVAHLALIDANHLPAVVAVLGEHGVKAAQAVGLPLPHDVPLPAQLMLALLAGEVLHVPGPTFGLGTLIREDDLRERREQRVSKGFLRYEKNRFLTLLKIS